MTPILVRDLMHHEVLTLPRGALFSQALLAMVEKRSSYLVVTEGRAPVGILTERDMTRMFAKVIGGLHAKDLKVDEVMTPMPMCITENVTFEFALTLSHSRRLRHLPVVNDEDCLVGIVTMADLLDAFGNMVEKQHKLEQNVEELRLLTLEDALLGIGNRRAMEVELSYTEADARRHHRSYAVGLFDIDRFKKYNDRYGHQQGDIALKQVAQCIQGAVRESDRVFRYGGEEILVLMPQASIEDALMVGERVRKAILDAEITHEDGEDGLLTISGGVAALLGGDWHNMVKLADEALYRAKNEGRNRVCAANESH